MDSAIVTLLYLSAIAILSFLNVKKDKRIHELELESVTALAENVVLKFRLERAGWKSEVVKVPVSGKDSKPSELKVNLK